MSAEHAQPCLLVGIFYLLFDLQSNANITIKYLSFTQWNQPADCGKDKQDFIFVCLCYKQTCHEFPDSRLTWYPGTQYFRLNEFSTNCVFTNMQAIAINIIAAWLQSVLSCSKLTIQFIFTFISEWLFSVTFFICVVNSAKMNFVISSLQLESFAGFDCRAFESSNATEQL